MVLPMRGFATRAGAGSSSTDRMLCASSVRIWLPLDTEGSHVRMFVTGSRVDRRAGSSFAAERRTPGDLAEISDNDSIPIRRFQPAGLRVGCGGRRTDDWKRLGDWTGREPLSMQYPLAQAADDRQYMVPTDGPPVSLEELPPRDG